MVVHEKEEALQPFLNGDHGSDDSRDGSLELPELTHTGKRVVHHTTDHDDDSSWPSSIEHHEGVRFEEKPPPLKRPATYAIALMLGAQIFSASMNVSIRLLENASTHLHPLQVSFSLAHLDALIFNESTTY